MKLAIVLNVPGRPRQVMNAGAGRGSAACERSFLFYRLDQLRFDQRVRDAIAAGVVVHLAQIGAIPQPPRSGQLRRAVGAGSTCIDLYFVQKPGKLSPAVQCLLQLDLVRVCGA